MLESLLNDLEGTAHWRRGLVEQFPQDNRNETAAKLLEQLSTDLRSAPNLPIADEIADIEERLLELSGGNKRYDLSELSTECGELRRRIGFSLFPRDGNEYLRDLLEIYSAHLAKAQSRGPVPLDMGVRGLRRPSRAGSVDGAGTGTPHRAGALPIDHAETQHLVQIEVVGGEGRFKVEADVIPVLGTSIEQRPAAYRFELRQHKVDVLPELAETEDRQFAVDTYDELVAKARELVRRLQDRNSARRACDSVERLLVSLGAKFEDLRPGVLLSRVRTIEADRIAFDSEEARAELFADALSMLDDTL